MEELSHLSDTELLLEVYSGNARAFELIYQRHWKNLFRHANLMLRDEDEAKDVVQDIFTMLWTKSTAEPFNLPLAPYLYTAIRNNILNRIKHLRVEAKYNEYLQYAFDHLTELPDTVVLEKELARQIEEGTLTMPCKMREIFIMSRQQHLTHKEISEQLNISDKTVKRQISNALKIMRNKLGPYQIPINLFLLYIL